MTVIHRIWPSVEEVAAPIRADSGLPRYAGASAVQDGDDGSSVNQLFFIDFHSSAEDLIMAECAFGLAKSDGGKLDLLSRGRRSQGVDGFYFDVEIVSAEKARDYGAGVLWKRGALHRRRAPLFLRKF